MRRCTIHAAVRQPVSGPGRAVSRAAGGVWMAVVAALLTSCSPTTVTMPDVVGMQLDEAHRALEALGVDEFDDVDVVGGDRIILVESNWVVVEQSPAAGTSEVNTGTTIDLSVGKVDDPGILDLIPAESPVARELKEQAEAEAQKRSEEEAKKRAEAKQEAAEEAQAEREEAARRLAEAREYAEDIEEVARGFAGVLELYEQNSDHVHTGGGDPVVAAKNALAAQEYFELAATSVLLIVPPDDVGLDGVHTDMSTAAGTMADACQALLDAIDTGAPSAFATEQRHHERGTDLWTQTMHRIYEAADREPILPAN